MGALLFSFACPAREDSGIRRTGALDSHAWDSSVWISAADTPVVTGTVNDGTRAADGASWFISTVKNQKEVSSARWMTSALGVYDIYINGRLIGDEILKPGFTHYEKTRLSFTYDITSAFDTAAGAENMLSAQVTPGWWADKIITPAGHEGMIGRECAFRGVLELTYTDGSRQLFRTDTANWKAGIAGPVTHAAIFDGEEYDARILPGHATPEKLSLPEVNEEFKGELVPSDGAEVYFREDLALSPAKAYVWEEVTGASDEEYGKVTVKREYEAGEPMTVGPGENLVIDFGQNCAGVPSFVFNAAEGTVLECITSEILNDGNGAISRGMDGPEGSVHRRSLRIPDSGMRLEYTFAASSDGDASYRPRCTFFGYRYVSITASAEVTVKKIESIPVSSVTREMECGSITTGNEMVNRLISNTLWGQRSNYLSVPTDCPQRNERLGWTADTQVFAETGTFFANTLSFFRKWMRDMTDSQNETGAFPGVAPLSQYGNEYMRLGWADAGIIVPWTMWKQFGDTGIIDSCWESMDRFMNHINDTRYDHTALAKENMDYQWADWLSYEPLESCGGGAFSKDAQGRMKPLPEAVEYWNYLSASYWLIDAGMMRDMAAATGRDASRYEKMAADAKAYIKDRFITSDGRFRTEILNTMQTPALFALKNGIVDGKAREDMISRLRKNFEEHGNCLQTGFLGTSILMPTLTENGMSDIAWELLLQRKNPSWLYSIDNGATTIWERWNSYTIEKGMGPMGMNSFNHYAYGAVCEWIWESVAGIASDTSAPGFRHIIMKPVPDRRLGHVDAVYGSASGVIKSSWKYEGDKWIWNFTIPKGCTASVTVPGEREAKEYAAGEYQVVKSMSGSGETAAAEGKYTGFKFTEASELNLIGKILEETQNPYHRVDTCRYKGFTQSENEQVRCPAGLAVVFRTDSPAISVRSEYGYYNMDPNTMGIALRGYDLYIRKDGDWIYAASKAGNPGKDENLILIDNMDGTVKECMLYLPIYSEMHSVKIGVREGSTIEWMESPFRHRIAIFGSSFTHGISISRSGMSYPMQFMRHTGLQILSLGCNGNCRMQPYFADVLADADVDAMIFDAFSNPDAAMIEERLFPFIENLQESHPDIPLIFLQTIYRENRNFDTVSDRFEQAKMDMAEKMMKEAVKKYNNVYFVIPDTGRYARETSVDGTHPSDMGYLAWSESIEKPILKILKKYGIK